MPLTHLPNELLTEMIIDAMPDGFESLAVTCKQLYALCSPLIERHQRLRKQFYQIGINDSFEYTTSYDVIARIAAEPMASRYLRRLYFASDGDKADIKWRAISLGQRLTPFDKNHYVAKLLSKSSYLKQAGLDWKEYYAKIREDVSARQYLQYAAAFLLTLLPNVNSVYMSNLWRSSEATNNLIDTVIRRAQRPSFPHDDVSLIKVSEIKFLDGRLHWVSPLLGLPNISSFDMFGCTGSDECYESMVAEAPDHRFGGNVESIHFSFCCLDDAHIGELLNRTPRLQKLTYVHSSFPHQRICWDVSEFVSAIEEKLGQHLVELSFEFGIPDCEHTTPGTLSMRGFQHLRKLKLSLEMLRDTTVAAEDELPALDENSIQGSKSNKVDSEHGASLFTNILPASLTHLFLFSPEKDHEFFLSLLKVAFEGFSALKASRLPALDEISLYFPRLDVDRYFEFKSEHNKQVRVIWRSTGWWWTYGWIREIDDVYGYTFRNDLPPDPQNSNRTLFYRSLGYHCDWTESYDSWSSDSELDDSRFDDDGEGDDGEGDDGEGDDGEGDDGEEENEGQMDEATNKLDSLYL